MFSAAAFREMALSYILVAGRMKFVSLEANFSLGWGL